MKTLIIYKSVHKKNTEKIAKIMAEVLGAELAVVDEIRPEKLNQYDLIGFGSGIYAGKFHNKIYKFIKAMPQVNRKIFIFCTSGSGGFDDKKIKEKLTEKGCRIIKEFHCSGEFSPLGINLDKKGHPDEKDKESAHIFAKDLLDNERL